MSEREAEFRNHLLEWAEKGNLRQFLWRETTDPYEILIAELLLRRTLATKVEPVYEEFLELYPDFVAVDDADRKELEELLRPLGLQNQRARALKEVAEALRDGGIPSSTEELLKTPHIGMYAAHAVACFGYGEYQPIVDTNVARVYGRVFGKQNYDQHDDELWAFAEQILPPEEVKTYNLALLDFAAEVCTAQSPACEECFASGYCDYYQEQAEE